MAFKKNYYERKQVAHRAKYGKLEKRSELITRLKKKKEHKKLINDAKSEIENVTGKEYFFKYNTVINKNGKISKVEFDTLEELKKKKLYVDNEIIRIENKLKQFSVIPKNKRFVFDDDGNKKEIEIVKEKCLNEDLLEYETYLRNLIETKQEITNKLK
ncbi:uncharacterized protein VNE69_08180 [Vairimorpha necatrix]|uniref:U3 small nucleolar RNA-associated protein 11 n=1 Tax=Vairimorpha necatrix TaxID=6039 RepID=A0AAX4JEW8_9MICR